jgi:hypothetical protein
MPRQLPPTNMIVLKPTRRKPVAGDLFVCNMRGERWVAGRVVHTNCRMMSREDGIEALLYFYRMMIADPAALRPPLKPDLLIPPIITNFLGWRHGYFQTLGNYPLAREERLPRHYFLQSCYPVGADDPRAVFCDEYGERSPRPERGEYWGGSGLSSYRWIDDRLSEALGIPCVPEEEDEHAPLECAEDEVILFVPAPDDATIDIHRIEGCAAEALLAADAGGLEGDGYDLQAKRWDVRFVGPSPAKMAKALLPVLKKCDLPPGAFLLVGGRRTKRINL